MWQGVDPVEFIREFPDRIYHVHIKDAIVTLNGRSGILASHLNFGDPRRGWDFRSPGRGGVNFEEIIRALNQVKYEGPLSVEWEDCGMDREHGAREACEFVEEARLRAERRGVRRGVRGELSERRAARVARRESGVVGWGRPAVGGVRGRETRAQRASGAARVARREIGAAGVGGPSFDFGDFRELDF